MADAAAGSAASFPWHQFFERAAEPLFLVNRWRRLLFVNQAFEQLTGLTRTEAQGLTCKQHRHAEAGSREALLTVLAPPPEALGGRHTRVQRLFANKGKPSWWTIHFTPLRGKKAPLGVLGTIHVEAAAATTDASPLPERLIALRERLRAWHELDGLESDLPATRKLAEQARLAGNGTMSVFLVGERGSGKHWLARAIHQLSARASLPFAALDCANIPPAALSAMLFGDPLGRRPQLGTLYLHEIACLPRDLQERLCRQLEGEPAANAPRLLAGTCVDPQEEVRAERLLDELYCRLSALTLNLPPLRERRADLPRLLERLLAIRRTDESAAPMEISAEALALLQAFPWPGNLRELQAVLHDACARHKGHRIEPSDLRWYLQETAASTAQRPLPLKEIMEDVERRLMGLALERNKGNKARAAEMLGVWRQLLVRRMKALGLEDAEEADASGASDSV